MKTKFGKSRKPDNPYAVYKCGGWEWKVLKTYQRPDKEQENPHARWFCFVTSPDCPYGEYGDVYVSEILNIAYLEKSELGWQQAYDQYGDYSYVNRQKDELKRLLTEVYGDEILDIVEVM
jgi:hypothetical protein